MTETAETTVPVAGASESTPIAAGGDTSASTGAETEQADRSASESAAASDTNDSAQADESLLSDEEFESLQDDPAKLRAALQSAYTKKTQTLGPAKQLLAALQRDPQGTIKALAKTVGLSVPDSPDAGKVQPVKDKLFEAFETALGPESAAALKPALEAFIDERLKPITESHQKQMERATADLAANVEKAFTVKRPDWKKHESAMKEVAKRVRPSEGVEPIEYLDMLYVLATGEGAARSHAERLVSRISGAARAISESKVSGAAPTAVAAAPKRYKTPREAAEATIRGE